MGRNIWPGLTSKEVTIRIPAAENFIRIKMHAFVSRVVALLILFLLGEPAGLTAAETNPSAAEILSSISKNALKPGFETKGSLRMGSLHGLIRISRGLADGKLVMRLGRSDRPKIYEWTENGLTASDPDSQNKIPIKEETEVNSVLGLPLSFEEVSLGFLNWPNPIKLNDGRVYGRSAWLIQLNNPQPKAEDCKTMLVWVEEERKRLVKVEGYDYRLEAGKHVFTLLKRIKDKDPRNVDDSQLPSEIEVQEFDRDTGQGQQKWFITLEKVTEMLPSLSPPLSPIQFPVPVQEERLVWPWWVAAGLGLAGIVALKFRLLVTRPQNERL